MHERGTLLDGWEEAKVGPSPYKLGLYDDGALSEDEEDEARLRLFSYSHRFSLSLVSVSNLLSSLAITATR